MREDPPRERTVDESPLDESGDTSEQAEAPRPSLTRQAAALASGSLATQAAALLLLVGLTRLVSKTELGAYQQLNLIYGIVSPLLVAGIPAALLYFVPRTDDPTERKAWVGQAYLVLGALGLATSFAVIVWRDPLASALGNPDLGGALLRYAPYPFLAFVTAVMPTALVAVGRAGQAAVLNALGGVFVIVAVLGAVAIEPDAEHMALGLVVAQLGTALIATVAVQRSVGIRLRREQLAAGAAALLRYGLPLALTGIAGRLAFQFDRLVVSREFSPALFAVYVVGAVELPLTVVVQQSVNSVLVPALARHHAAGDLAGMAALWRRAIRRTSLVLLPLFVFFMLTANATVEVLFGGSYSQSVDVFRVYLLLVPVRVATYGLIPQAIGRTGINLTASFVLLVANVAFVLALVGPLGLTGPAWGTIIATFLMAIYYLVRLRSVLNLSMRALFPWRVLAVNLALTALAGIPAGLVVLAAVSGVAELAVAALLFAPSYVAVMRWAGRLQPDEVALVRRTLGALRHAPQRVLGSGRSRS